MTNNKQLLEYRVRLLDRIRAQTDALCAAARAVKDPFAPVEENGWNTHQLIAHVWHVDKFAYGLRIRRTLNEPYPIFPNYDGEAWMANAYSPSLSLETLLSEFQTSVDDLLIVLRELPPESWSRLSRHEIYGEFTLQTWVERALAHIEEHLATIQKQM